LIPPVLGFWGWWYTRGGTGRSGPGWLIAISLVRSWHQKTCWKTPREGYDEHNSKFPSVVKPRFIELVGERTTLTKVDAC
jgi:hypothetical protein